MKFKYGAVYNAYHAERLVALRKDAVLFLLLLLFRQIKGYVRFIPWNTSALSCGSRHGRHPLQGLFTALTVSVWLDQGNVSALDERKKTRKN